MSFTPEDGPADVDQVNAAFGPDNIDDLLPEREDIPEEYHHTKGDSDMLDVFNDWFYNGAEDLAVKPVEGIDAEEALMHIKAAMTSFEPKHERKTEGIAWLLDEWFEEIDYEVAKERS